ncbi:conserved hypothetical protein [Gammaproteobacteria bacterium]
MAALALRQTEPRPPLLNQEAILARLTPIPHSPESTEGTPYYDEEFEMAQSIAHGRTIHLLLQLLNRVAARTGLQSLSDNPIWYMNRQGNQTVLYPDFALTASQDPHAITAKELLLTLEVVSTSRREKEQKDSVRMRDYNSWNRVPEFVLIYPEPDDHRSVVWYQYHSQSRSYRELALPADRRYRSQAIPGLEIEILTPSQWTEGRKIRVYYLGEEMREGEDEYQARKVAERVAEQERLTRKSAECMAEQERLTRKSAEHVAEQERLARKMAERVAEQERLARKMAEHVAEQERLAKEAAEQQIEQLLARLKQAGIT